MTSIQSVTLNPVLKDFWTAPARIRVLYGGRFSSKTWDAAGIAIFLAQRFKLKFMCTRQFQSNIKDSVYSELKEQIYRFNLQDKFKVLDNEIRCLTTGSVFIFKGLYRSINEIRGTGGIDICWIEEGHSLTQEQWEILEPTVARNKGYQFWLIFNPRLATDFAYKQFIINTPPDTIVKKINYTENPFLNPQAVKVAERLRDTDNERYRHIYLGEPLADDDDSIIKRSWIMAAIDAHKVLNLTNTGSKRIGFDIADSGHDKCATVYIDGLIVKHIDQWQGKENELLKSCTRAYLLAQKHRASVTYDSIGVGAGCGAKFNELNQGKSYAVKHTGFNAGGAVDYPDNHYEPGKTNREMFSNIKAQAWWLLADRFKNTYNAVHHNAPIRLENLISIDSNTPFLEQLIEELSTPKRDYDALGRVKVESKKDLLKRGIDSPNVADAAIMATLQNEKIISFKTAAYNLGAW